eukprot:Em0001g3249a
MWRIYERAISSSGLLGADSDLPDPLATESYYLWQHLPNPLLLEANYPVFYGLSVIAQTLTHCPVFDSRVAFRTTTPWGHISNANLDK